MLVCASRYARYGKLLHDVTVAGDGNNYHVGGELVCFPLQQQDLGVHLAGGRGPGLDGLLLSRLHLLLQVSKCLSSVERPTSNVGRPLIMGQEWASLSSAHEYVHSSLVYVCVKSLFLYINLSEA